MRLFLIRHGETVDNVAGLYAGTRDSSLTAHGVVQARRLASHLATVPVTHLFSSNLQRAVQTAEFICDAQKDVLDVVQLPSLREKDFGPREGVKSGMAVSKEGSETFEAMMLRANDFLDNDLGQLFAKDCTVCVIAHGIILGVLYRAIVARLSTLSGPRARVVKGDVPVHLSWSNTGFLEGVMSPLPDHPSSSSTKQGLQLRVEHVNCVSHLNSLKKTAGGIANAKYDSKQKTMDSFFKSIVRKRKAEDESIVPPGK